MSESVAQLNEAKSLPQGWRWIRLGEICEINPSCPRDFSRPTDAPTTFAPMAVVDEKVGTISKPEVRPYLEVSKGYTYFEEGDVLFAKITPCMQNGKHAIASNLIDGIGFGTTEFHVLRPRREILPEWIHFFIRQPYFLREATMYFTGAVGQQRVPESFLTNYVIPLPPLPEQKRVAAKVRDLLDEAERACTACEAELKAARAMPLAYLRQVFESEEAKEWERKRLGEVIILLKNGIVAEQNFEARGFKITRIETISNGTIDPQKIGYVSLPVEKFQDFRLQHGDIVFSHINSVEKLGNCAIYNGIPDELFHGMNLLRIRVNKSLLSPLFLFFWLRSDECRRYYTTYARRAIGQASLNQTDLRAIPVPLPDLSTQQCIISELRDKMVYAEKLKVAIEKQLDVIRALPQAILRKAFRGEL